MTEISLGYLLPLKLLPAAVLCLVFLAALGGPVIAVVCEHLAGRRQLAFLDKFARHMADMSFRCGVLLLLANAAGLVFLMAEPGLYPVGLLRPWLTCSVFNLIAVGLILLHGRTWALLTRRKRLHTALGIAACLTTAWAAFLNLGLKRASLIAMQVMQIASPSPDLAEAAWSIPAASAFWPLLAQALVLSLAAAGAMGLLHLLWRRSKDEYGRDYYAFALRLSARWALWPTLAQLALQGWLAAALLPRVPSLSLPNPILLFWGTACFLTLIACILWLSVIHTATPLRRKPAMAAAALALALAGAFQASAAIGVLLL